MHFYILKFNPRIVICSRIFNFTYVYLFYFFNKLKYSTKIL